jgi:hypothetical protein
VKKALANAKAARSQKKAKVDAALAKIKNDPQVKGISLFSSDE